MLINDLIFIVKTCVQFIQTNNFKIVNGDCKHYSVSTATLDENSLKKFREVFFTCRDNSNNKFKFFKISKKCPSYVFFTNRNKEEIKVVDSCRKQTFYTKSLCAITDVRDDENGNINIIVVVLITTILLLLAVLLIILFKFIKVL